MMDREKQKGHEVRSKDKQLSFCFLAHKKNGKVNNVVYIDEKRQRNEKSLKEGLHNRILKKFLRHSEQLDW